MKFRFHKAFSLPSCLNIVTLICLWKIANFKMFELKILFFRHR